MYPWETENLLKETSIYTTHDQIVALRKENCQLKYRFGRESDIDFRIIPCREDEPVCCDESSDPDGPFCYFYTIVFKKVLLRLPLYNFEREFLTEMNIAPAQLHPNSWAFVRGFSILCTHFGLLPSLEVFLYFFELWVSFNGVARRELLSLFQQSYKRLQGQVSKGVLQQEEPTLLNGFPLYWT